MSRSKVPTLAFSISSCLFSFANAENDGSVPAYSPASVTFNTEVVNTPQARTALVRYLQSDASKLAETADAKSAMQQQTSSPSDTLPSLPKSSRDEKDATRLKKPTAVKAPIELDALTTPDLALDKIGKGDLPDDATLDRLPDAIALPLASDRGLYLAYRKQWVGSGFCHQPLYFEDAMLERHGHERFPLLQPYISGAKFFGTIPLAPYKMTLQGPLEDRHTLGSYRAGSATPLLRQRLPYDATAIRNQLGASAAAAVAIP